MKVGFNQIKFNRIGFQGYKPVKSEYGDREYEFNYVYDDSKKDCYLEIFLVDKDENGNYLITGERDDYGNFKPITNYNAMVEGREEFAVKLNPNGATSIDLAADYGIAPNQAFAYHYVLRPKGDPFGTPEYKIDAGNVINETNGGNNPNRIFNLVTDRASSSTKGGAMKLIVPDINNVAWVYDNFENNYKITPNKNLEHVRKTNKNFANKIGGSLAGIEKDLEQGKLDNFTRIITTPLFTDDSLSAHAYWNKNCFQMAQSLGNINNYASLQRKMFAKGMNLVSDGAYVNEGLEGVHFRHVLQWGKKSPYFNWFRISGLQDSPLSMGVFGKKIDHVTHRIVNSKYDFEQKADGSIKITSNRNYKSNKPTFIQIYDDRLVNAENLSDTELIKAYDKTLKNNLDINNHNDSVVPYSFQINSDTYKQNVELLSAYNKKADKAHKINLKSGEGTRAVAQFEYFGLDGKHESGFETWDANPDIAKLNYIPSHYETINSKNIETPEEKIKYKKHLEQCNMQVQDYAVTSAKYWTKKTNQILVLNAAQKLDNIKGKTSQEITDKIDKLANGKDFPEDLYIDTDIVKNVIRGRYTLQGTDTAEKYDKAVLQGLTDMPLDSVEVGDDIVSVLSSPYMSKRAIKPEQIGLSRFEMMNKGNKHVLPEFKKAYEETDKLYEKEIKNLALEILKDLDGSLTKDQKLQDASGNTTPYGKYVLPLLTAEIAKFAIIKGIDPKAQIKFDKNSGEISYDYNALKSTSMLGLGIIADSPEDEALELIKKLKSNIKKIDKKDKETLKNALALSLKGTTYESFALADMIVDRMEAGLDWRIDATKDIADIDSLKSGKTNYEYTMNQIIKFWSKFTDGVKEYHPDAYIAAEVTDPDDIYNKGKGGLSGSRYSDAKEGVRKLINEAGFTTIANYDYLSSGVTQIFGKLFDELHPDKGLMQGKQIFSQLAFYFGKEPLESIIYSYTFAGNHDKCRALEGYAVDMDMVYADLTDESSYEYRKRAYKILHAVPYGTEPDAKEINGYDYSRVSTLAIAKSESILSGMGKAKEEIGLSEDKKVAVYGAMLRALRNLSNSKFQGKVYEADGFGTKDFNTALDIVLEEMDNEEPDQSKRLSKEEKKRLKDKSLEFIIDPAMSKLLGQMKFLVALTGNPTLFAGDEYGSTGFETTTKNIFLQNRNIIREDWADENSPEYKKFVERFKNNIDDVIKLRKRPELQPLNDGAPFLLDIHNVNYSKPIYEDNFSNKIKGYENGRADVSALLRQSPDGAMTVSVFNTEGLTHKFDEYYRPAELTMDSIGLGSSRDKSSIIGGLRDGIKFYDAAEIDKEHKTVYEVKDNLIKRQDGQPIKFKDSTLILYSQPSFTGRRVLYNPQYNFVSSPYTQKKQAVTGSKLQLLAK